MNLKGLFGSAFFFFISFSAYSSTLESLPSSLDSECTKPEAAWIWCDDFEVDRRSAYFEGSTDRQASLGINNSVAAAFHFKKGESNAGALRLAFGRTPSAYIRPVDKGTKNYREIYWRMFVFVPTSWVGNGAYKLSRATILAADDWSQAMIAHIWSGQDPGSESEYLFIDPASGTNISGDKITSGYNDFKTLRWLGKKRTNYPVFANENFGEWQCIEAHVKLNDPNQNNGIFQLSINGVIETQSTSLNWVGYYSEYGINAIFFENYWNRGSPVNQTRYFDNIVVSTEPIGCGANLTSVKPNPPTDLTVY